MSLNKRNYVAHETIITAENLNNIQEAILANEAAVTEKVATFDGQDLSQKYTFEDLHQLIAAENFSDIHIGDYYPIKLNGTYTDAATQTTKTISNETVILEVAAINPYIYTGDTALTTPHIAFISRDCLANTMQMRSESVTWYDTDATNPWLGSAAFATLNDADNGIIKLLESVVGSSRIFNMQYLAETMASGASGPSGWVWLNRGKLWLPTETEVYGRAVWQSSAWNCGINYNQFPLFAGSSRHIVKCSGHSVSRTNRCHWWLSTAYGATAFCNVSNYGNAGNTGAANAYRVPLCFLFT